MLADVSGGQTVNVSTVRRMVRFGCGDSNVKDKPRSGQLCTAVTLQNEEHLYQLIHANQQIMTRELCAELNIIIIRKDGGNTEISLRLHQVSPTDAQTGTKGTLYVSLSGHTEPIQG